MSYVQEAEEKYFDDLLDNEEFQEDLKKFFSGGRYNYSEEKLEDTAQLADDFAQHMRWQSTNEATAIFDLLYVQKSEEEASSEGKVAFGKLMQAYDTSKGGGTGFAEGAWDYLSAFAASPSTGATVATMGFGVGSKIAAKATSKTAQMSVRAMANKLLQEGLTKQVVKEKVKKSVKTQGAKAAGISFLGEAAVGGVGSYGRGKTREAVIEGYDYGPMDLVKDAAIDGTIGAALGGAAGAWSQSTKNKAADIIVNQAQKAKEQATESAREALTTIRSTNLTDDQINDTLTDVAELAQLFRTREAARNKSTYDIVKGKFKPKEPLDVDAVKEGEMIFSRMLDERANELIAPGLDMNTVRGIAAASIRLKETLKVKPGERIGQSVAKAIANGDIQADEITRIRREFNLSAEEISYLWLAELSKAGKVLAEGSKLKKIFLNDRTHELDVLAGSGASVFTANEGTEILRRAEKGGGDNIFQKFDQTRIAFMTSQVGTTMANVTTGGYNLVVDMSDAFWKDVLDSTMGRKMADGTVQRRWTNRTLSTLKGFTFNRAESEVLGTMLLEDAPLKFTELFYETQRVGELTKSDSFLNRSARFVNTLNMATDSVFKQGAFYGAFDRRLREINDPSLGRNFSEYLQIHTDLNAARQAGVVDYATDYAKRFTFQKGYEGDNSLFGKTAQGVQHFHKKVPFVVSYFGGMPFPRYVANHLEYVNDYTPIGIATGGFDKAAKILYGKQGDVPPAIGNVLGKINPEAFAGDPFKTGSDRFARQMTGTMLTLGGIAFAAQKNGEIDYDKMISEKTGAETDIGRTAGPWAANALLGDVMYRWYTGKPLNWEGEQKKAVSEVLAGMGDLGFDFKIVDEIGKSVGKREVTEGLEKEFGNFLAVFTYPGTIARDMAGQLSDFARGNPYTRDYWGGPINEERNFLEEIIGHGVFQNQALRFLMDSQNLSLGQTGIIKDPETGEIRSNMKDLKLYSPFNPTPVGGYNPITRQFGFTQEPPSTELQKELNLLGLEEYNLYGSKQIPNATVDYAVRQYLALGRAGRPSMAEEFKAWKDWPLNMTTEFAGRTYNELGDDYELKEIALKAFVNSRVREAKEQMTRAYEDLLTQENGLTLAAGYLRNAYVLKEARLESSKGRNFDDLVAIMTRGEEKEYKTAQEFLDDSSSIQEELAKRRMIMRYADENTDFEEDIYPEQFISN